MLGLGKGQRGWYRSRADQQISAKDVIQRTASIFPCFGATAYDGEPEGNESTASVAVPFSAEETNQRELAGVYFTGSRGGAREYAARQGSANIRQWWG